MTGDEFRDQMAKLLRTRYEKVETEVLLTAKKADISFEINIGPRHRIKVAAECKHWDRSLTRDNVRDIIGDYEAAREKREIDELWIICERTPAAGARDYVHAYRHCQIMTATECEQAIVDFQPLLTFLAADFKRDAIAKYYIPPTFYGSNEAKKDLHTKITAWLNDTNARPIAIWAGYGMGKTSYARYLASLLADTCSSEYGSPIPILINLGEFTTAPDIETLIVTQLANHYGVRFMSSAAFRLLNEQKRFVLILDGFDEMKFAMAPNEFNFISAQIRKTAAINPKLLLLGRPDSIENEEERQQLTSSRIRIDNVALKADEGPDFESIRLAPLSRDQYLALISNFLISNTESTPQTKSVDETMKIVSSLDLGDILERPVQAKMLAEVVADPLADIKAISRFSLYELFIKRILRREAAKSVRKHLGIEYRTHFMRLLAWWLWTVKKTRTFTANEIPTEIIQKFQMPGVPLEGLRRELLIGSVIEEKNIGIFLAEKDAGVFYFPHTSFTEFLVADYIMSTDFLGLDVPKLPDALYGEVPTFLKEHPSKNAIAAVYERMKSAKIAMSTQCITVLLNDFEIRLRIEMLKPSEVTDPWDVCLHYFFLHAVNQPRQAREFLFASLKSTNLLTQLSAMYCFVYEDTLAPPSMGAATAIAHLVWQLFAAMGAMQLTAAAERTETTVRSPDLNHIGELITCCVKFMRGGIIFDFAEFSAVTLRYFGNSCVVSDVVERIPTSTPIPGNNIIQLAKSPEDRALLAQLFRYEGSLNFIPVLK